VASIFENLEYDGHPSGAVVIYLPMVGIVVTTENQEIQQQELYSEMDAKSSLQGFWGNMSNLIFIL